MTKRNKILFDCDGVVADLMGGFQEWLWKTKAVLLKKEDITHHHIAKSPALQELHKEINLDNCLDEFLSIENVYQAYVVPIDGSISAYRYLKAINFDITFVTATLKNAPQSYASKFRWLQIHFGSDVDVISCPSHKKQLISGDFIVDDRYDICKRFGDTSLNNDYFVFKQPWNEAPEDEDTWDWPQIVDYLV